MDPLRPGKSAETEPPLDSRLGYDQSAEHYEDRPWFDFWKEHEAPIVRQWLAGTRPGLGLDAGSGTGLYLPDIAAAGNRCVAADLSPKMLDISRARHATLAAAGTVRYEECDISRMEFPDRSFDWALCIRTLSHVRNLERTLAELVRVLKPGGEVFLGDLHPEYPYLCTTMPTDTGLIRIATYKHPLAAISAAAAALPGAVLLDLREYRLADLETLPPKELFPRIHENPLIPIFYTCVLRAPATE